MTRPSTPASAIKRLVPAPSSRYGIPRSAQPAITFSITSGRASSIKNSAGPPIPNEVRDASGSPSWIPASPRSHARLVLVRQVIAQPVDVACAHEQDKVVRSDGLFQCLPRALERPRIKRLRDLVRE